MFALIDSANVYTEDAVTGKFTVLLLSAVPCRLINIRLSGVTDSASRAELASMRRMIYGPGTTIPEQCQIEVDRVYWAPRPGTFATYRDWNAQPVYLGFDIIRQQVGAF